MVTAFDGSTKFLKEILVISRAISELREAFSGFVGKYDEELREFRYGYELFLSVVLNEEVAEEEEVLVPEPCAFMVTNGAAVLNANNAFLVLAGQPRESVVGHPYAGFVPDVYRDIHRAWAGEFVERVEDFEGKPIAKCFAVGSLEIKLVEMEHRVLPRFLDGLEIFTLIHPPAEAKGERRESFVFLVEKETYYIKNVEAAFFDIVKFKVSQRSFKLLQEMSLTSVFEHFTTSLAENPARETTIFPHFL